MLSTLLEAAGIELLLLAWVCGGYAVVPLAMMAVGQLLRWVWRLAFRRPRSPGTASHAR